MLSLFKEMWLIVEGLIRSARALVWVMFLLCLTLYVCAILITMTLEVSGEPIENPDLNIPKQLRTWPTELDRQLELMFQWTIAKQAEYFGTVPRSGWTLFQVLTLDHWMEHVVRPISSQYPIVAFFVFVFALITTYGMLNVVVGVLVQNTVELAQNREMRASRLIEGEQKKLIFKLKDFFVACDTNKNGLLEKEELDDAVKNPRIIRAFKQIALPVMDFDALFKLLDSDRKGEITFEEFVLGCLKLKTPPSGTDMMKIVVSMGQGVSKVNSIESRCINLQKDLHGMQYALAGAFSILSQTSDQLSQRIPEVEMRRTGRIEKNKDLEKKRFQQATMRTHCHTEMHTAGSAVRISQRNTTGVELLRSRVEGSKANKSSASMPPSLDRSSLVPSSRASRVLDDY
jgi:voltage-gated sodium channel